MSICRRLEKKAANFPPAVGRVDRDFVDVELLSTDVLQGLKTRSNETRGGQSSSCVFMVLLLQPDRIPYTVYRIHSHPYNTATESVGVSPNRHCLHEAQRAVRCSVSGTKGDRHPPKKWGGGVYSTYAWP